MRRRVVVVVPLSLSNPHPYQCHGCLKRFDPISILCPYCEAIQDPHQYQAHLNHFTLLGLDESLKIDRTLIDQKWIMLSKKAHPDKFICKSSTESRFATQWTNALNKARSLLRDFDSRVEYLFELYGYTKGQVNIPIALDLAEMYFEVQESNDKEELLKLRQIVEVKLNELVEKEKNLIADFERLQDKKSTFKNIEEYLKNKKYLESMLKDMKTRGG